MHLHCYTQQTQQYTVIVKAKSLYHLAYYTMVKRLRTNHDYVGAVDPNGLLHLGRRAGRGWLGLLGLGPSAGGACQLQKVARQVDHCKHTATQSLCPPTASNLICILAKKQPGTNLSNKIIMKQK